MTVSDICHYNSLWIQSEQTPKLCNVMKPVIIVAVDFLVTS